MGLSKGVKILFLDIDGVVNSVVTAQRHRGVIGIDPYMAILVDRIVQATGCKIVLSSTWRLFENSREEVRQQVGEFIACTPSMPLMGGAEMCERGKEIKAWLEANPTIKCDTPTSCPQNSRAMCNGHKIERFAILDDNSDMLPEQSENFFKTSWSTGLTQEIANEVIKYLNG